MHRDDYKRDEDATELLIGTGSIISRAAQDSTPAAVTVGPWSHLTHLAPRQLATHLGLDVVQQCVHLFRVEAEGGEGLEASSHGVAARLGVQLGQAQLAYAPMIACARCVPGVQGVGGRMAMPT